MKLPISWLHEFVKTNKSAEEIADKLTMAGLEVEEILNDVIFEGVVIGEVKVVEKHPGADKLNVAKVNVGKDELQIVCGAPNLAVGQMVPVALAGAKLGDFEIGKAVLRGVESHGMICSEKELGLGENHDGIMVLEREAKPGTDFGAFLGKDKVLDVNILANRPDCMSIIGLANEVAAVLKTKNNIPPIKLKATGPEEKFKIEIKDDKLCPRYIARIVRNVSDAESPQWMQERLLACGVRPISLLVDISNYVMLEYGQPLHFFDLEKLSDKTIVVRSAKVGEEITTLDGVKRKLNPDNLVIANSKKPIALAGVMGGSDTEIDKSTKNIFIEAAVFDKASIRRTSRALGLRSEAVARFEKGIGLMTPEVAINRAAELLAELAGGEVSKTVFDTAPNKFVFQKITVSPTKLNAFLGTNYTNNEIVDALTRLSFTVKEKTKYSLEITVPFWRIDIDEPADIYEEVARLIGYDRIPSTLPFEVETVPVKNENIARANTIREHLSSIGLDEIMTYSFTSKKELESLGEDISKAPALENPLVKEQEYMRTNTLPKMLEALSENQYRADRINFFEIGKSFQKAKEGQLPLEESWLSLGIIGGTSWPIQSDGAGNFYDLKGSIMSLLGKLKFVQTVQFEKLEAPYFESGRAAKISLGGKIIGEIGDVNENTRNSFGLKKPAAIARINIDTLFSVKQEKHLYGPISKFPTSTRDISAIFDKDFEVEIARTGLEAASKLIQSVVITDIYSGKQLAKDEKSVSFSTIIGSDEKTLTDVEVEKIFNLCLNKIKEFGGKVRERNA